MKQYRLYILSPSGMVHTETSAEYADDDAAFASAMKLSISGAVEIWDGTRKVCLIDANAERNAG